MSDSLQQLLRPDGSLKNPLDGFTSYSTQFVMLACRTTNKAREFATADLGATLQAINSTSILGGEIKFGSSNGDLFLVMDTRRFSQFTIDSLRYDVFINGLQSSASHGNLASKIQMRILDSVGISFMNYLQWLMDSKMQCGFDGMIFMLRVIFVGHKEDGSSETVQTVTIPMQLFKLDVNLDFAKGIYDCEFMPNFNFDVNTHYRWFNIGQATNYFTPNSANTSLGAMINSFQEELNKKSKKFYSELSTKFVQAGRLPAANATGYGRPVNYMITIPSEWEPWSYDGPSLYASIEKAFAKTEKKEQTAPQKAATGASTASTTPAKGAFLSVDPGQTITQVLDIILKQTSKIKELGNAEKQEAAGKPITFYKYLTTVTSDNASFTVHVDVIPFQIPKASPPLVKATQPTSGLIADDFFNVTTDGNGNQIKVPKSYFQMNYTFTGKNVDILNFDLKMQNLQFLLASSVKVGEGEIFNVAGRGQTESPVDKEGKPLPKSDVVSYRPYDPILIPLMTPEQLANFSSYVTARTPEESKRMHDDTQAYLRNLSAFYAQSPVMVKMTIKGNPDIMEKFNHDTPPLHVDPTTSGAEGSVIKYRTDLENEILRSPGAKVTKGTGGAFIATRPLGISSYTTTPVFAKINIKGPNVDFRSNELIDGQEFAKEVLFSSYYTVMKVSNVIERGVFTQELELFVHSVYGNSSQTSTTKTNTTPAVPS